jgi:hypothetical protein
MTRQLDNFLATRHDRQVAYESALLKRHEDQRAAALASGEPLPPHLETFRIDHLPPPGPLLSLRNAIEALSMNCAALDAKTRALATFVHASEPATAAYALSAAELSKACVSVAAGAELMPPTELFPGSQSSTAAVAANTSSASLSQQQQQQQSGGPSVPNGSPRSGGGSTPGSGPLSAPLSGVWVKVRWQTVSPIAVNLRMPVKAIQAGAPRVVDLSNPSLETVTALSALREDWLPLEFTDAAEMVMYVLRARDLTYLFAFPPPGQRFLTAILDRLAANVRGASASNATAVSAAAGATTQPMAANAEGKAAAAGAGLGLKKKDAPFTLGLGSSFGLGSGGAAGGAQGAAISFAERMRAIVQTYSGSRKNRQSVPVPSGPEEIAAVAAAFKLAPSFYPLIGAGVPPTNLVGMPVPLISIGSPATPHVQAGMRHLIRNLGRWPHVSITGLEAMAKREVNNYAYPRPPVSRRPHVLSDAYASTKNRSRLNAFQSIVDRSAFNPDLYPKRPVTEAAFANAILLHAILKYKASFERGPHANRSLQLTDRNGKTKMPFGLSSPVRMQTSTDADKPKRGAKSAEKQRKLTPTKKPAAPSLLPVAEASVSFGEKVAEGQAHTLPDEKRPENPSSRPVNEALSAYVRHLLRHKSKELPHSIVRAQKSGMNGADSVAVEKGTGTENRNDDSNSRFVVIYRSANDLFSRKTHGGASKSAQAKDEEEAGDDGSVSLAAASVGKRRKIGKSMTSNGVAVTGEEASEEHGTMASESVSTIGTMTSAPLPLSVLSSISRPNPAYYGMVPPPPTLRQVTLPLLVTTTTKAQLDSLFPAQSV